jgi:hypothetical protein
MKTALILILIISSLASNAQVLMEQPKILELRKYRTVNDRLELRYIREKPRTIVRLSFSTEEVGKFLDKFLKSEDLDKLNCDGEFSLIYIAGAPVLNIKSIKTCLDVDGQVAVHSVGMKRLSEAEINASKKIIEDNMKPSTPLMPASINDTQKAMEKVPPAQDNPNAGVFSDKFTVTK